ncbi:MAG TPA: nucleotidyltransferase family protein [Candidatus Sulfotelmatobacter sp.]
MRAADETRFPRDVRFAVNPEWNLLLAACSATPPAARINRISALIRSPIRWDALFQLADQHGVTGLLYQSFAEVQEAVPSGQMRRIRELYEVNLHKVLLTAGELLRILDCLDAKRIEVIPYKGVALAETLYGDFAARQSGDIDLLIRPQDLTRITEAVKGLGYTPHRQFSRQEERAYLTSGYERAFDGAAGINLLEVHWALQPRFYAVEVDMEGLFRRAVPISVAGREMRTLSPEDLALVLSLHAAKHLWARLIWLCDIARLAQSPSPDWKWIESEAQALGMARILRVTLLLAHGLLQAPLPAKIESAILDDRAAQEWTRRIGSQVADGGTSCVESWSYFRDMMKLRERPSDRMRFLWRLALTPGPGEWQAIRLSESLFPLYRIVRLSRLAARLVRR